MYYFDSAATSFPKPQAVIEAVTRSLTTHMGNPGRSAGGMIDRELFRVREAVAAFFGVRQSSGIIFTPNATAAINLALFGLLKEGDRVVTTSMEHNAVVRPLARLRDTRRVRVDVVNGSDEGYIDPDDMERALDVPARMIVMNHASNICGAWNELIEFGRIAHNHGTLLMVDASQSAGVIPIDVERDGVDILACSGHKNLLGPSGTGLCYLAPGLMPEPFVFGGTGSFSDHETMPDSFPDRFEAGTMNFHGLIGLGAGIRYLSEYGAESVFEQETRLARRMHERIESVDGLRIWGPRMTGRQLPVFSISCPGSDPAVLGNALEEEFEIMTRTGLQCAPWAHRTIRTYPQGTVRLSASFMMDPGNVDVLGDALRAVVRRLVA